MARAIPADSDHVIRFANKTTRIELSGLLRREGAERAVIAVGPIKWTTGQESAPDIVAELKAIRGWTIPENRGEGLQIFTEPFDAEAPGGKLIYEDKFDAPLDKAEWQIEGPMTMK